MFRSTTLLRNPFYALVCVLALACDDSAPTSAGEGGGDLLPLEEGRSWTYRVTDGDEITTKTVTVGAEEPVGGDGPNKKKLAFKTKSERDKEVTLSWQALVDGKIVRYRDQTTKIKSGEISVDEYWSPYRLHVDMTDAHTEEGASFLEEFEEVATKSGELKEPETIRERWTVLSTKESVTVPAGTFDAVVIQKAGGTKLKTYWYVPGIGKVKETGGQTEELVDFED